MTKSKTNFLCCFSHWQRKLTPRSLNCFFIHSSLIWNLLNWMLWGKHLVFRCFPIILKISNSRNTFKLFKIMSCSIFTYKYFFSESKVFLCRSVFWTKWSKQIRNYRINFNGIRYPQFHIFGFLSANSLFFSLFRINSTPVFYLI